MVSADTGVWSYSSHCGASVLLSKGQNNLWRDYCLKWCLPWIKLAQKGFNKGDIILWSLLRWKDAYFLDILTDGFHWGWSGLIYPHLLKRVLFLSTSACHLVNCLALPNIFHWVFWSTSLHHQEGIDSVPNTRRSLLFIAKDPRGQGGREETGKIHLVILRPRTSHVFISSRYSDCFSFWS